MSPCPWRNDPGTTTGGPSAVLPPPPAVAAAEKSRRVDGRPEVGSPPAGRPWAGAPRPPCPPHADGGDEPRSAPRQGGESYRPSLEPEMRFSSPRWALCLSASLKCRLKSECII